jgi:hypothetical protein
MTVGWPTTLINSFMIDEGGSQPLRNDLAGEIDSIVKSSPFHGCSEA